MDSFMAKIAPIYPEGLPCEDLKTLQVNLGRNCNLRCEHCHLDCSPQRSEQMSRKVMQQVVAIADQFSQVDITGGAPECHPDLEWLIGQLSAREIAIQVRTNLAILSEPRYQALPAFYRRHNCRLVGSMPCYQEENVDAMRGHGVYQRSIRAIQRLNELGYGDQLQLNLVYNPGGPFLPGPQIELEEAYRTELKQHFNIRFSSLLTITNMPIGRFKEHLSRDGELDNYIHTLEDAFNVRTLDGLMCRHQVCVDWDGALYDCDFNLALGIPVNHGAPDRIEKFDYSYLRNRTVQCAEHCLGCTAGAGSSCAGALA